MKKYLLLVCLLAGCKAATVTTPPAALIPGATSQFDQDTYKALATAHAFAQQAASNPAALSTTAKTILNQFIVDLNAADVLYSAFHAGQATVAQMQAALSTVTTDQSNFATQGVK